MRMFGLVESAHGEAVSEHRRHPVANFELSASTFGLTNDSTCLRLLLRVMGVASRSRTAFSPAEVSLERAALPVSSQSAPPSARVFNDGSSRFVVGRVGFMRAISPQEDIFLDDMGVHSSGGVSRVRISQFADDAIGSWRGWRVRACELFSRCELDSDVRGHWPVPFVTIHDPVLEIPN